MIYITGDTHGTIERFDNFSFNKEDKIIVLGDFGFLFQEPLKDELKKINNFKGLVHGAEILFIDGNHDNFEKINNLKEIDRYNSKVGEVIEGVYHLKRGNIYTIENKTFFTMGGALSIDKHLRIENVNWWKEEEISYKDIENGLNNLEKVNYEVDYVLTHTAPEFLINDIYKYSKYTSHNDPSSKILNLFYDKIKLNHNWFFGHLHIDTTYMNNKFISLYERLVKI